MRKVIADEQAITDAIIRSWIKLEKAFEGMQVDIGLYLRLKETDNIPVWHFRYFFSG